VGGPTSIHQFHSLNQDQGSVFTLWECAQSIHRIKLSLYGSFLVKKFSSPKKFFRPRKLQKYTFFTHPIDFNIRSTPKLCHICGLYISILLKNTQSIHKLRNTSASKRAQTHFRPKVTSSLRLKRAKSKLNYFIDCNIF
jgi:hypothetical protein